MLDLIIRNGRIVTATEVLPAGLEIGVRDGKIAVIGLGLDAGPDTEIVDAEGAYITPGGVDSHAHIEQDNSPTGDTWTTGSRSAIAGGNTTVLAFASQRRDETRLGPCIERYHAKATGNSYCDYGFHVIVTNATDEVLDEDLPRLARADGGGITSVKLYMTYAPLHLGDGDLFRIMLAARSLGVTTMIHAENHDMVEQIMQRLAARGHTQTQFHAVARPQIAETEATYRAISLAAVTDAPILLVHMSAPAALEHVRAAQARLLPIHAETCPHYLYLTSEKLHSHDRDGGHDGIDGAQHICAPPLRHDKRDLEQLWAELANGTYTVVSSDHAPALYDHPEGKKRGITAAGHVDFRVVPNGLPGIETRLPLLFDRTYDPEVGPPAAEDAPVHISLPRFVALTSTNPAQLYGLAHKKGSLQPGLDADIVVWYPATSPPFTITNAALHHRIDYTPFEGRAVCNWPRYVFLRGRRVWDRDHGGVLGQPGDGQYLPRTKSRILTGQPGRTAVGMGYGERKAWM
ncbi:dihydropyrimidinase [Sporothrix schenckii 1099-18]|uniref:dihydropyrimidinase n=2 Tax=Sporothrix schenckii TaxID=29908 RepID=U7PLH3_SPOS1|nr:dihydropyrimidinase [Sporothrix schenckii 1099-18]ERS96483.1 dihydropyrimidinase [Sporothrix schenckii ATCC 58251]KJR87223.1 dihydropyrimidinase [Sporothrix schenckii 1099-18]